METNEHLGLFSRYQPLSGRDWLRQVSEEDRKAFGAMGFYATLEREIPLQSLGGKASAAKAKRVPKGLPGAGRFMKQVCPDCHGQGGWYEDVCGDGGSRMWIECECGGENG